MNTILKILIVLALNLFLLRAVAQPPGNPRPIELKSGTIADYYNYGQSGIKLGTIYLSFGDTGFKPLSPALRYWQHNGVDSTIWLFNMDKWTKATGTSSGGSSPTSFIIKDTVILDASQLDVIIPHGLGTTPSLIDPTVNDPLGSNFIPSKDATNIILHYPVGVSGVFIYTVTITP